MAKEPEEKKDIPSGDDVVGTGNDARLKRLQEINDRNDEQLATNGDLADVNDDGTTSNFAPEQSKTDEQVTEEELARAAAEANQKPATEEQPETPPTKYKIKVNGKELELTPEELIARAQKVEAADEYLKEAKEKLHEAERQAQQTSQPSAEDAAARAEEEEIALVRAIQMGTEEEARAALRKIRSSNNPPVSPDDIARTVDERLTFNEAVNWFQNEYSDLAKDQTLLNIVLQRDKDLLAQGDRRSYRERYDAIGKEVRGWRDSIAKPAPTETKPPVEDKQARKAAAQPVPKGADTKAPAAEDEEDQEESVGEVISAMAKARGGPQWLRG